jgi:hypothetical protein
MTPSKEPWLRPFEFHLIQRMYLKLGIWSGEELLADLEKWVRNDPRQNWRIPHLEWAYETDLHRLLSRMTADFLWSVTDVWDARRYAQERDVKGMKVMQERLGPARLVWEHKSLWGSGGYYSVDHFNPRLESLFNFRFTGPRAGSDWHREIVAEYANILQSKGRWVTVDTGTVESQLPDITFTAPDDPLKWRGAPDGVIEVEMEAHRKSDEAILRNLEKNRRNKMSVRFVVMSEKDCDRISSLIERATRTITQRVENYPGQMRYAVEIEVMDSPSGHPYMDFLQSEKIPGYDKASERSASMYPKILTAQEEAKERKDRGRAETPQWSEGARKLLNQREDEELDGQGREDLLNEDFERDEV